MESLILAINIVFPIFFIMALGYIAKEKGFLDKNFVDKSTWLVFYIALPLKLFYDIKNAKIEKLDSKFLLYIIFGVIFISLFSLMIGKIFIKDNPQKLSAFTHASYRSNFVYVGFPIIDMIYNKNQSIEDLILVLVFGLSLYSIIAVILLTYYGKDSSKKISLKKLIFSIIKNPMIIGILAGVVFNYFKLPVYSGYDKAIEILASLSTPLSLILIGASLEYSKIKSDFFIVMLASLIKTVLIPLIMIPVGIFLGLSNMQLGISYVFWASPVAVSSFIFTKQMKSDYKLVVEILSVSFIASIFTFPIGIFLMQSFDLLY